MSIFGNTCSKLNALQMSINRLLKENEQIMTTLTDLQNVQAQEKTDLAALSALIPQLLTAVANGSLDSAGAQTLLTAMQADDSTIKTTISSIQAALPPVAQDPPTPPPAPTA